MQSLLWTPSEALAITTMRSSCHACSMTHTKRENDVLDEYPLAPLGVCCPALLMSLSVLDLEVSVSFYTTKNLLQNLSLSTCIKPTGEVRLFSNCFSLAAELAWLWVNLVHVMALLVRGSFRSIIYALLWTVWHYLKCSRSSLRLILHTENEWVY